MNIRKFIFTLTITVSTFLFCTGMGLLSYVNHVKISNRYISPTLNEFIKPFMIDKEPFNVLFMVKDNESNSTDTILLINFDPSTLGTNIMSIPRDTYYNVKGSQVPKINSAYKFTGIDGAARAVGNLLDVNIKYYVRIDIETFREIVDLLGGVEFYVPVDLDYDDNVQDLHIHLKKGMQVLNGDKAEQLLRFRKTQDEKFEGEITKYYDGSDLKREEMQKEFIKAIVDQKMNIRYLPQINNIIEVVFNNIATNITLNDALQYSGTIVGIKSYNINWHQLPGKPMMKKRYWVFFADEDEAIKIASQYFPGKDSFVDISENSENNGSQHDNSDIDFITEKSVPNKRSEKNNVTKGNPSNSNSNIKPKTSAPM